jgi:hypothetical protein
MEIATIRSHKSHMWPGGRPVAASQRTAGSTIPEVGGRPGKPMGPGRRGRAGALGNVRTAACQGFAAACMVDASARREASACRVRRVMAETARGPARAIGRAGRAVARWVADGAHGREAGTVVRRAPSARGSGIPLPVRGHRRGPRGITGPAWHRAIGKGQEAYFAADGTWSRGISGNPWLSLHESLLSTQDLLSATLSNKLCVQSNIFKFVMT